MIRWWLTGALALVLAACSAPAPKTVIGYRDTTALIGATSRFDLNRFAGAWLVREYFPTEQRLNVFDVIPEGNGTFTWVETTGQAALGQDAEQNATSGTITGQGRFRLDWDDKEYWVLWVDEGFRTAVIGTPNGQFGYIVDRSRTGGADRINAAREILDFNGYDVSQLRVLK